jgi:hypothetical protein
MRDLLLYPAIYLFSIQKQPVNPPREPENPDKTAGFEWPAIAARMPADSDFAILQQVKLTGRRTG